MQLNNILHHNHSIFVTTLQCWFTKKIIGLSSYSYEARLSLLGLESLEARDIKGDLQYVLCLILSILTVINYSA